MAAMQAQYLNLRRTAFPLRQPPTFFGTIPLVLPLSRNECDKISFPLVKASKVMNNDSVKRRQLVLGLGTMITLLSSSNQQARAEKAPSGYQLVLDNNDGYAFYCPFGWQEVIVKGQDVALKDVIEPLESVGVSIVKTERNDLHELGSPQQVAKTIVEKFLVPPSQKAELLDAAERDKDGKTYYTFEFLAKAPNYTRHGLGAITVSKGKFYTLVTGANQRRWSKMQDKLQNVTNSFKLL